MNIDNIEYFENVYGMGVRYDASTNIDNGSISISIGVRHNEMQIFKDEKGKPHNIEWVVYDQHDQEDIVVGIGLVFKGKILIDYDGVYELPEMAIKLIRRSGYRVPKDMT